MIYDVDIGWRLGQKVVQEVLHLFLGVTSLGLASQLGCKYVLRVSSGVLLVIIPRTLSYNPSFAGAWLALRCVLEPCLQVCIKGATIRVSLR